MPDWVVLARLRRVRGLRGELVAESTGSAPERFEPGLKVHLVREGKSRPGVIESAWLHGPELVLKFQGIETRTEAEALKGFEVCIPAEDRPPAPEGEYYYSDLVGCRVETVDGRDLGEITAWHDFGAAPLLEVHKDDRELLVPFTAAFYRKIDLDARRIVMELPEGLEELSAK
jgi:16S rRNA processing protein RimM